MELTSRDKRLGHLWPLYGGECAYCGLSLDIRAHRGNWRIPIAEHMVPISRGGHKHKASNMALACGSCNIRKGNLTPEEWILGIDKYDDSATISQQEASAWLGDCVDALVSAGVLDVHDGMIQLSQVERLRLVMSGLKVGKSFPEPQR